MAIVIGVGLTMVGAALAAPTASADHSAPPGYAGPVNNCPGNRASSDVPLISASRVSVGGTIEIWYAPPGDGHAGTYCAFTRDNIGGAHHMELVIRRADFQTPAFDSGTYDFFAGGMEVFGVTSPAPGHAVFIFGRVTVNGVNYERRVSCDPNPLCHIRDDLDPRF